MAERGEEPAVRLAFARVVVQVAYDDDRVLGEVGQREDVLERCDRSAAGPKCHRTGDGLVVHAGSTSP